MQNTHPHTLKSLAAEATRLGCPEFISRYPHPVLLDTGLIEDRQKHKFHTEIDNSGVLGRNVPTVQPMPDLQVIQVCKGEDSPYSDRVSVGRTKQSDIQILHRSVSKFHAYFISKENQWFLVDANSKNGTFVNSKRVEPNSNGLLVDDRTIVTFGKRSLRYHLPKGLFEILKNLSERHRP
ncbi:MAG: FHA domain-containing protein [Myxococcota bacterium]